MALGFVPHPLSGMELYVAIGIIGATVMPHNLYLHSALVQSRDVTRSRQAVAEACKYNLIDSAIAMNCAFLINVAILIVAAATFWQQAHRGRRKSKQAHQLLDRLAEHQVAPIMLRLGADLLGAEFDDHRNAGRANHDGGFFAIPRAAVAATAGHAQRWPSCPPCWSS